MIKHITLLLLGFVLATPLTAETPLDAAAFDAYSRGKTLYFGLGDKAIGAEEYLPNHRVRWSLLNGVCQDGRWYQDGPLICFLYDGEEGANCWAVYQRESGLVVRLEDDPAKTILFELEQSDRPMACLGPEVGV